jgi:hypothetical protein
MATGNHSSPTAPSLTIAPRRRRWLRWVLVALALIAALVALFLSPLRSFAQTGASYGARVACSCRFVGGRALSDCKQDFEPGMELVTLSENVDERSVTARFALIVSDKATYRNGWGCVLDSWK